MSDQQHIFKSGDKFSNYYEIDSFLEKSHSSAVYTARNTRMNHPVTIRVFSTQLDSEEELEVFELEARALIRLNHPNIVRFYHYGVFDQMPFIVMEDVDGIFLRSKISDKAPMAIVDASRLAIQICSGLQYAHKFKGADGDPQPIYHQDLTPENIMLNARDVVRITDFRLAQTSFGMDKNNPYIAPEQLNGNTTALDEKTDIYLLGLIICEMLSDKIPFARDNFEEQLLEESDLIKTTSPAELLVEVNEILQKCLAEDSVDRYDSMDDLGIALGSLQQTAALIQKATNYDVDENYDRALETWKKASSYLPNNREIPKRRIETEVKSLLLQAEKQEASGNIAEALEIWRHVLTLDSENEAALHSIEFGKLHLEINQLRETIDQQQDEIQKVALAKEDADLAKENIERDLISKSDHVDRLEVDLGSFPDQVREQEEEIEQLTRAREESGLLVERLQTEIEAQTQQVQELTDSQTELESVREELEAQLNTNTELISKLENDVENRTQQVQELTDSQAELESAREELEAQLNTNT
ncbi:TPA: serine/threonine protein kinase, partial [Candidatus Poribacteria bacterium]|nr:serine/threonine protein kinase [Candidatus Poribacteria bacterium]